MPKLIIMCFCTFTLYEIYWFYKNWKRIAERERITISPQARGLFAVFYCYQCFARIRDYGVSSTDTLSLQVFWNESQETPVIAGRKLAAVPLAIGWIVTTVVSGIPAPYSLISLFAFLFLVPVQKHANRVNAIAAPTHDRNARLRGWNWFGIVLGGLFTLIGIAGTILAPDGGP
ncbi:MAG TPA: hypothetical protein VKB50_31215 [Vicinamibacterales bacterium]|nr:hypothetical protein [Vicinamibacterales bacterium]